MLDDLYERCEPPKKPEIGFEFIIPTGPAETAIGKVIAIAKDGTVTLCLPGGTLLWGYYAKCGPNRIPPEGGRAPVPDFAWIWNRAVAPKI